MSSLTLLEAIFTAKLGRPVRAGEVIQSPIDLVMAHDATFSLLLEDYARLDCSVWDKERLTIVCDHFTPPARIDWANLQKLVLRFAKGHEIADVRMYQGICHQLMLEDSRVLPGSILVGADSHTTLAGAVGCFATGLGATDILGCLAPGQTWFRVPESIRVTITGARKPWVTGRDLALRHLQPQGRALWLEDPLQNLYGRAPVALPGWVRINANSNFRSPRSVVRMLQNLLPEEFRIEAQGALHDGELVVLTYRDAAELTQQVKEGIRLCLAAGYRKSDTAVVSYSGREKSLLFPYTQLGPHSLKTFSGRYDLLGQPLYTDGDVLLESVYRFKGQAAPAIVFAEIDFEQLDERAVRKLFVGATRAMMKLVLVVSERSAALLLDRMA